MNIARCRGYTVFVNLRSLSRAPRATGIRAISSSNTALKSKKKTESIDWEDLPRTKIDPAGSPIKPLEPLLEYKKPHHAPSVDVAEDEERLYKDAIASGDIPDTALAKQVYLNWKRFPDCVVLTRVGKFYESYFAPAIRLSSLLNLKLANRKYSGGTWPFSGFPTTHLDKYLKILVQDLGQTVVLVEEIPLEDDAAPSELKPRKVGRVVTPGTLLDESWLNGSESRYLLALAIGTKSSTAEETGKVPISLAYTDASTGEFFSKDSDMGQIEDELARVAPREVVLDSSLRELWETGKGCRSGDSDDLLDLLRVLGVHVSFADPIHAPLLDGLSPLPSTASPRSASLESRAITLLRHHLQYALRDSMPTLPNEPQRQLASSHMQIDAATLAALEIRHAIRPGGLVELPGYGRSSTLLSARGTLLSVISQTVTAPGHRLLIRTLTSPSTDIDAINSRLSLVEAFVKRRDLRDDLRQSLKDVGDIMRVVQRFRSQRGSARDIWDTATWVRGVDRLLNRLKLDLGDVKAESKTSAEGRDRLLDLVNHFKHLTACAEKIEASVDESSLLRGLEMEGEEEDPDGVEAAGDALVASSNSKKDKETKRESQEREREEREQALWWIRPGFSKEMQEIHDAMEAIRQKKEKMQEVLRKRYDTQSLILTKGMRHGYHIAVSKKADFAKLDKTRKFQSISEAKSVKVYNYHPWTELGESSEILMERRLQVQKRAFIELRKMIVDVSEDIQQNAALVDELDLSLSFAQTAVDLNYVRPTLTNSTNLNITNGRHPAVESALLTSARSFTPNSTTMNPTSHLHLITGPNQGGKSTLLRQTAVICILAQCGSFVPADAAEIGIVDKVFSRIGARDDLFRDRSTFMLEMVETAAILRQASNRSLVIMDEIGRGTTLHAGMSIAYATLDHLLKNIQCRTLFATHYHELATMLTNPDDGKVREGVDFYCTDVNQGDGAFSYQYKLKPGVNTDSHAIKAAKLAGMPESFLSTAQNTLDSLQATVKST